MTHVGQRLALAFLKGYQLFFSSLFGRSCRYYPTCSSYTRLAVKRYGAFRGGLMGLRRILRCHPWHPGGYDPVPEKRLEEKQLAKEVSCIGCHDQER